MADPAEVVAKLPWPQIAVLTSAGLLGWALATWGSMDRSQPELGEVRVDESVSAKIWRLKVPDIESFEHYYGDSAKDSWANLNPFIPADLRKYEAEELDGRDNDPNEPVAPPKIRPGPNPTPEPSPTPQRPVLEFSDLRGDLVKLPVVYGGLAAPGGIDWVLVKGKRGATISVSNGDAVNNFTFVGIAHHMAVFEDSDGFQHRVSLREEEAETSSYGSRGGSGGDNKATLIDLKALGITKKSLPQDLQHIDLQRATSDGKYQRELMKDKAVQKYIKENPEIIRKILRGK